MSLGSGTRLGPYEIVRALGAGGMGEVYLARDTKLGREDAVKIVSDGFGQDPERISRFQREAHLLAALNHPHIAAIYGLEEANGTQFLVLELLDGETLAQRLAQSEDRAITGSGTDQITAPSSLIVVQHFDEELKRWCQRSSKLRRSFFCSLTRSKL